MMAWQQTVADHGEWLRGMISSRLSADDPVDDILQETIRSAIESGEPEFELRDVKGWLAGIAKNKVRQHIDSRCRERRLSNKVEVHFAKPSTGGSPFQFLLDSERSHFIAEALGYLDRDDANLLRYKYFHGWSYSKISEETGLNTDAVTNRLRKARQQLRHQITELYRNPKTS